MTSKVEGTQSRFKGARRTAQWAQKAFPAYLWHDVDLEARALAVWEETVGSSPDAAPEAAAQRAWERLQPLLEQDEALRAEDVLYALDAERMVVQPETLARKLLFHGALNRFAVWPGDRFRYFSRHPLSEFNGPVPAAGLELIARAEAKGVRVDEIVVFRAEKTPDPILAVRVGEAWYAVSSWV